MFKSHTPKVLYEDNHLIAVVKPSGMLSQGDRTGDVSMYDMVKDYIRIKKGKPSLLQPGNVRPVRNSEGSQRKVSNGVFLGLLHRLDRPVSGIMIFAKTSKGASRLSEQFRNHEIQKFYHAIVLGKPKEKEGILVNKIEKFHQKASVSKNGKEVVLHYKIVCSSAKYTLLKIMIESGKFHQIRAQLASAGFPILGDVKYKGEAWDNPKAIALCATDLAFTTATEDKKVQLHIDLPKEWEYYIK